MAAGADDHIVEIAASVGELRGELRSFIGEFRRDAEGAQAHRRAQRIEMASLAGNVQDLTGEMRRMRPMVETLDRERSEGIGARRSRRTLYGVFAMLFGSLGAGLLELLKWLFHSGPR